MTSLQYLQPEGEFRGDVPLSLAVKVDKLVFVSGIPAYDKLGKLAVGDFTTQMKQAMESIGRILPREPDGIASSR